MENENQDPSEEMGSNVDVNDEVSTDSESGDSELEGLEKKANEFEEECMRLRAEMENMRKRTIRDVERAHKYALEKFVDDLLPVVDSLEKGLNVFEQGDAAIELIKEGTELTHKQMHSVLNKHGLEMIDPSGEKFDPENHEALTMLPSPEHDNNTVMDVIQKGYRLNGRLVRPARVVVSKKP